MNWLNLEDNISNNGLTFSEFLIVVLFDHKFIKQTFRESSHMTWNETWDLLD